MTDTGKLKLKAVTSPVASRSSKVLLQYFEEDSLTCSGSIHGLRPPLLIYAKEEQGSSKERRER